jgi:putative hemolysin
MTSMLAALPYGLSDLPLFILLPLLLIASGFFSGSETALFSLSSHQRTLIRRRGGVVANIIDQLLSDPQMLLITLMFGNMTVNVLYFVISSALLLKLDPTVNPVWFVAGTIAPLLMIIALGEVMPKIVANTATATWVRFTCVPLFIAHKTIGPLRLGLQMFVIGPLARLFAPSLRPAELSSDELRSLVEVSKRRGVIDPTEERLLYEVVRLSEIKVRDIMVPRVDLQAFDLDDDAEQLRELIIEKRLTKIPVYRGDLDHIEGVIYAKQFLLVHEVGAPFDLSTIVRQVRYVPELQRVDQLLGEFRRSGTHLAVAVDEYGGTAGLATLKDVVERLVGDVDFDTPDPDARQVSTETLPDGTYRVDGRLSVQDWIATFGQKTIPPRVTTVGGIVAAKLGRIPRVDDQVQIGNLTLKVEQMTGGRVESLLLSLKDEQTEADA